jgi:hypothetical protein
VPDRRGIGADDLEAEEHGLVCGTGAGAGVRSIRQAQMMKFEVLTVIRPQNVAGLKLRRPRPIDGKIVPLPSYTRCERLAFA